MPRKRTVTAEIIKGEFAKIATKLEKGQIDRKDATALATVWKGALDAIKVENQQVSERVIILHEEIAKALSTGDTRNLSKLLAEVDNEGGG